MKKIISTLLAVLVIFGSGSAFTYSAINNFFEQPPSDAPSEDGGDDGTSSPQEPEAPPLLVVPAYRDYGRSSVDFSAITYSRPNIEAAISDFLSLADTVSENAVSFDNQLLGIQTLDDVFFEISSMYTYANIMSKKNTSNSYWNGEFSYISVNFPRLSKAIEDLYVACAQSVHNERFEEEYFGDGLIEEYYDGGNYSDTLVSLLEAEASLEAEYSALSTSTVTISYKEMNGTVDFLINHYYDKYGKNPVTEATYVYHRTMIINLYYTRYAVLANPIFISLLKTRSLIKDELDIDSYTDYAYEGLGHDYGKDETVELLSDVSQFIMPLYYKLFTEVFKTYEKPDGLEAEHENAIINTVYSVLEESDEQLFEAFCYMLQHGLFDISPASSERYDGAFTAYIDKYNSPFIFISTKGDVTDYFTVLHEFGHFFDAYVNYGKNASLDLSEISSQALELLIIKDLGDKLGVGVSDYLIIRQFEEFLATIRTQSFYSMIEHKIYELSYDDITESRINSIIAECEQKFYYPTGTFTLNDLTYIPHLMLYPAYVQSYTTSALVSLELLFMELDEEGTGLSAYKELLLRGDESSFESELLRTGLRSPFDTEFIKYTVDKIHYFIYGSNYFTNASVPNAA